MEDNSEIRDRLADVELQLSRIQAMLRWSLVSCYFVLVWGVIPLAVYRWTGWHILGWWAMGSLVLGIVADHYARESFDSWRPRRR